MLLALCDARKARFKVLSVTLIECHSCCCSLYEHWVLCSHAVQYASLPRRWEFKAKHFDSLLCFKMVSLLIPLILMSSEQHQLGQLTPSRAGQTSTWQLCCFSWAWCDSGT